nr:MAG TPA: endonuclease [Caudoviricetes sp.]
MKHNCYIGEWADYEDAELVTYDNLKEKVKSNNESFEYGLIKYGEDFMNGLMKELKIKDYFDKRKNTNLNRFNYCPYCGKKIDWKELKERSK